MKKKTIIMFASLFFVIILISNVFAYQRLCLSYGQTIPNSTIKRYTCFFDTCIVCVDDKRYPVFPGNCNDIAECKTIPDAPISEPPKIIINSPIEGDYYSAKQVLLDIQIDRPVTLSYTNNNDPKAVSKRFASDIRTYNKTLTFKEGLNSITIKAIDKKGAYSEVVKTFFVDSKKPVIKKTNPMKGFSNGGFEVQFVEANPKELKLYFGNSTDHIEEPIDISTCINNKGTYICKTNVSTDQFDNQDINYYFKLTDKTNTQIKSKAIQLKVDDSDPKFLNQDFFHVTGKNVIFNIGVDEKNLDSIEYYDKSSLKPKWATICSKLKEGYCMKKIMFSKGLHELEVRINDAAGNSISENISFEII